MFAVSDIHVDYGVNAAWVRSLSKHDYCDDVLILAGDVSDSFSLLLSTIELLAGRFRAVLFVPGNHDLWVLKDDRRMNSLDKFERIRHLVPNSGGVMTPWLHDDFAIVPLFGWYDFSFGQPSLELSTVWMDFRACRWPEGYDESEVSRFFLRLNSSSLLIKHERTITFSHFLPRIDIMPEYIPERFRYIYPVLGSAGLDAQIRSLKSSIHVYGHSHVNRRVLRDGVFYINSAFGYPSEVAISEKKLGCVWRG